MRGCSGGGGWHVWLLQEACVVARGGMHGCFGGYVVALGGACVVVPRGHAWLLWGACMVARGCVVAQGGAWLLWGACMVDSMGHAWLLPGGACMGYDEIWRYDQLAGGTHPTGMHSCSLHVNMALRGIN